MLFNIIKLAVSFDLNFARSAEINSSRLSVTQCIKMTDSSTRLCLSENNVNLRLNLAKKMKQHGFITPSEFLLEAQI